jgi:4-hydroxythreonine-4-phosphate dehydrogenase
MSTPRIIITSGEPAGIGPDVCLKALQHRYDAELFILGDAGLLQQRAEQLGLRYSDTQILHESLAVPAIAGQLNCVNAPYVLRMLDRAAHGCQHGEYDAMVTAPVQKSVIADSGVPFSGHTEYLAELTGSPLPVMMLVAGNLRVALATTHLPLNKVTAALDTRRLINILRVTDASLRLLYGFEHPRLLVCGVNPHAGEGGHLGREDIDIIAPAIEYARGEGIDATGPAPADTAFTPRSLMTADVVIAMYHDQGLPVIKHAGFGHAVNVTLGLPIIRTSVDHGTALALAGTGEADEGSLVAAIEHAIELARKP